MADNLNTDRLLLTPLNVADLDWFVMINQHPFVRKYFWDDNIKPVEILEDILLKNEELFRESSYGLWKLSLNGTGEQPGYCGFWQFEETKEPELACAQLPEFTGNGYMTEAGLSIVNYAIKSLGFPEVIATVDEPNIKSIAILERLGMEVIRREIKNDQPILYYRLGKNE